MSEFKVGDRVEYVGDLTPRLKRRQGTITEVWSGEGGVEVRWDGGEMHPVVAQRNLRLITPAPKVKEVRSRAVKVGDVIVIRDDDGVDRKFTVHRVEDGADKGIHFFRLGEERNHAAQWWGIWSLDFIPVIRKPKELTDSEKLEKLLGVLREESNNPFAKRALDEIGES